MVEISRRILFVDDDESILDGLRRQLRSKFDVTTAIGGAEGLHIISTEGPFAVVVADFNMPGMNGVEFLRRTRALAPETITVMLTGRADLDIAVSALHEGRIFRFLNKPCPRQLLEPTLHDCLEQYRLVVTEHNLSSQLDHANKELRRLNESLEITVTERTAVIHRLHRFVSDLNAQNSQEEIAELVVLTAGELLRSRRIALFTLNRSGGQFDLIAAQGLTPPMLNCSPALLMQSAPGRAFSQSQPAIRRLADVHLAGAEQCDEGFDVPPYMCEPLICPGRTLGVIWVGDPCEGRDYSPDQEALLTNIARSVATALRNQVRREERDEARDAVILALAKLAEHRDADTGAHLERVQIYCRFLCEALAGQDLYRATIDRNFIENVVRCCPLHDIGKVGIPDSILLKPGMLTPAEFEVMKHHTEIGGDTIRSLIEDGRTQDFLAIGMDIAYAHHEKFDGSGYPRGLAGGDIPLVARLVAVADVYDALTSKRVYKDALSHEEALQLILAGRGTHFDPDIVDVFCHRAEDFRRISGQFRDDPAPPKATSKQRKDQRLPV